MDEWYTNVRRLREESESPHQTEKLTRLIYHTLRRSKIREKGKFKQRMGPEFEGFVNKLLENYSDEMVRQVVSDDGFWGATLNAIGI